MSCIGGVGSAIVVVVMVMVVEMVVSMKGLGGEVMEVKTVIEREVLTLARDRSCSDVGGGCNGYSGGDGSDGGLVDSILYNHGVQ